MIQENRTMRNIRRQYTTQTSQTCPPSSLIKGFNFFLVLALWALPVAFGREIIKPFDILPNRMRTVVIDAGHGGHDPGCSGSDSREKHITLSVAKRLAAAMQAAHPDLKVVLTRDSDVFVPLHERAAIANRLHADLFISIHCNFMPGKSFVQGSETYVMGLHTTEHNLAVAKRENAAILLEDNYEANYDFDPNSPEGHIALSMFQSAFIEQSILFADLVEKHLALIGRKSRGVRQAGFVVLKATAMPSALIEIGFLSNKDEEDYLKGDDGQAAVTGAILDAFSQYRKLRETGTAATPVAYKATPVAAKTSADPASRSKPEGIPLGAIEQPSSAVVPEPAATVPASYAWPSNDAPKVIGQTPPPSDSRPRSPAPSASVQPVPNKSQPVAAQVEFCVQLSATSSPADLSLSVWKDTGFQVQEVKEDGRYKYQIRNIATYTQAQQVKNQVQTNGFPGAFISAYRQGQRISVEEAIRLTK